jgi:drug/metabolite transporter (DMT)-like permease
MLGLGFLLALFSSASLGLTVVTIRRGVLKGSPAVATLITVLLGVPLFLLANAVSGQLFRTAEITFPGYLALFVTGILQMAIGRYSFYRSIQAIGGNQAELFQALQVPLSIAVALIFLGESLNLQSTIGVGLVLAGPVLVVLARTPPKPAVPASTSDVTSTTPMAPEVRMQEGLLFGLIAIVSFSAGDVLARGVLADTGLGLLGGLVIYGAAAVALLAWVAIAGRFHELREASPARRWFLLAAVIGFLAQMSRYVALALAPVYVVVPLMRTVPLFVLVFSFFINRRLEVFSPKIVMGVLVAVLGLIILAL